MRPFRAMRQSHRLAAAGILVVLGLALAAGPAPAQEAQSAQRAAWQSVDVTLLDSVEVADPLMIVSAELPAGTRLPVEIAVPIPAGGEVQWAGEILGGEVSQDPQAQPRIESGAGYDLAVYSMRRARTAQVEVVATGAASTSGTQRTARLNWTSPVAVPQVTVAIRVAAGSKAPKAPAGSSRRADAGDGTVQYVRTYKSVGAGQRLSMELVYEPPAAKSTGTGAPGDVPQAPGAPGAPAAQGAGAASWAPWLLVVALAAAAYLWVTARKSARSRPAAEMEEEAEEAEAEEGEAEPPVKPRPKPRPKAGAARKPAARTAAKPKARPPKSAPLADEVSGETTDEAPGGILEE